MRNTPPRWAEAILRMMLAPADRDPVSGDLREEYVESSRPRRGRWRADVWYIVHVAGFVWRATLGWALALAVAFIVRTALDWLAPTDEFHQRAWMSTSLVVGILMAAGFSVALRTRDLRAGAVGAAAAALLAAVISGAGTLVLLAIAHDAATLAAIEGSGGLVEVFTLPFTVVIPAAVLGIAGGILSRAAASTRA